MRKSDIKTLMWLTGCDMKTCKDAWKYAEEHKGHYEMAVAYCKAKTLAVKTTCSFDDRVKRFMDTRKGSIGSLRKFITLDGHIAMLDASKIHSEQDLLEALWVEFGAPEVEKTWSNMLDWMMNLSWISDRKIHIMIFNPDDFAGDYAKKFRNDMRNHVFRFWQADAANYFENNGLKEINIWYCHDMQLDSMTLSKITAKESMEKTVKVNLNIKIARDMLGLAGFWKLAENGTDDEIFAKVLDMMTSYGAKTEIIEECTKSESSSTFSEFDEDMCNNEVAF